MPQGDSLIYFSKPQLPYSRVKLIEGKKENYTPPSAEGVSEFRRLLDRIGRNHAKDFAKVLRWHSIEYKNTIQREE